MTKKKLGGLGEIDKILDFRIFWRHGNPGDTF